MDRTAADFDDLALQMDVSAAYSSSMTSAASGCARRELSNRWIFPLERKIDYLTSHRKKVCAVVRSTGNICHELSARGTDGSGAVAAQPFIE